MSRAGSTVPHREDLIPEYDGNGPRFRTAIDDTSFSSEVKAKVANWHQRSHDLLSQLDAMLNRQRQTDPLLAEAQRLCDEARAILASIRSALAEALDGGDPLGEAVRRVKASLPPLAPAAAEAVCDLTDTEISAVRALNRSPPQNVRVVVCCCCTLLKLTGQAAETATAKARELASWEDAQAMLARPDFSRALKGYDPRVLHDHQLTAASVKAMLAALGSGSGSGSSSGGSTTRRALTRAVAQTRSAGPAALMLPGAVQQVTVLKAAVRSGGRAVGQLYLWCARVLAEADNLKAEEQLEAAQEEESGSLAAVIASMQGDLERIEQRAAKMADAA